MCGTLVLLPIIHSFSSIATQLLSFVAEKSLCIVYHLHYERNCMSGYFWYIYFIGDNIFFIHRERARIRVRTLVLEHFPKKPMI